MTPLLATAAPGRPGALADREPLASPSCGSAAAPPRRRAAGHGPLWLVLAAALFGCGSLSSSPPPVLSAVDAARLTAGGQPTTVEDLHQGRDLYVGRCASCHTLPAPEAYRSEQWPRFISEMTERAKLTRPQAGVVLRYLAAASQSRRVQ